MTQHDELLKRLDSYVAGSWAHTEIFRDAAAAIRFLTEQLEAAQVSGQKAAAAWAATQIELEAERKARENADKVAAEFQTRFLEERKAREEARTVSQDEIFKWQKRATAAESRLAKVFERTRERCEQICYLERDKADAKKPDIDGGTMNLDHLMGQGWMANLLGKRIRALQPEGEESVAVQAPTTDDISPSHMGVRTPASAADPIPDHVCPECGLGQNTHFYNCSHNSSELRS